ncbi:hypothetical protein CPB84DRAFT_1966176 [Gymnopilus junonius]|uniref:HMG box domain-containing protein n=1 Tax=Gymnopilus junonius TaxID=109634 RepID=A0A9P5NB70_GYMJU|nr:hypothetical protein CPB84DRAFT_1966176 [Gymnopilus junonius]
MPKEATKPKVGVFGSFLHVSRVGGINQLVMEWSPAPHKRRNPRKPTLPSLGVWPSLTRKAAEKAEKNVRKGKKDRKGPKRALSAYMFFSQDWRERIKAENPTPVSLY